MYKHVWNNEHIQDIPVLQNKFVTNITVHKEYYLPDNNSPSKYDRAIKHRLIFVL